VACNAFKAGQEATEHLSFDGTGKEVTDAGFVLNKPTESKLFMLL
jgi:hypothetical protein